MISGKLLSCHRKTTGITSIGSQIETLDNQA